MDLNLIQNYCFSAEYLCEKILLHPRKHYTNHNYASSFTSNKLLTCV